MSKYSGLKFVQFSLSCSLLLVCKMESWEGAESPVNQNCNFSSLLFWFMTFYLGGVGGWKVHVVLVSVSCCASQIQTWLENKVCEVVLFPCLGFTIFTMFILTLICDGCCHKRSGYRPLREDQHHCNYEWHQMHLWKGGKGWRVTERRKQMVPRTTAHCFGTRPTFGHSWTSSQ